jgi:hypothetical protein
MECLFWTNVVPGTRDTSVNQMGMSSPTMRPVETNNQQHTTVKLTRKEEECGNIFDYTKEKVPMSF